MPKRHSSGEENAGDGYEVTRLTVVRYLTLAGEFVYDVYWEDARGEADLTYEEKMRLVSKAADDALVSDADYEIVDLDDQG
ncbi:hypothetical protein PBI_CLUBL_27 [Gordonia phage ClubL]|uniref:Uncharacterized protein n=1 Tax=Gordonia phage ClubL TaxID=1838065 RepID=A0A160DEZ4_9CAUD|nr:hypothetical protein BH768_gp179 [Gordonia phage ClubL]ANA86526.1 hypothetical protein PBI_CLUBL_27 [Gordonia phage ClubL]